MEQLIALAEAIVLDVDRGPMDVASNAEWLSNLAGWLDVGKAGMNEALGRGLDRVRDYAPTLVEGMTVDSLRTEIVDAIRYRIDVIGDGPTDG